MRTECTIGRLIEVVSRETAGSVAWGQARVWAYVQDPGGKGSEGRTQHLLKSIVV